MTDGNASRISQFRSKGLPEERDLARRIPKPAGNPNVCPELSCLEIISPTSLNNDPLKKLLLIKANILKIKSIHDIFPMLLQIR